MKRFVQLPSAVIYVNLQFMPQTQSHVFTYFFGMRKIPGYPDFHFQADLFSCYLVSCRLLLIIRRSSNEKPRGKAFQSFSHRNQCCQFHLQCRTLNLEIMSYFE